MSSRMFGPKMSLLARWRRLPRGSIHSSLPPLRPAYSAGTARSSKMAFLGTGFGDRFKVSRGGSRRFEEGVRRTEELAELQGKRASKRSSLAV